MVFQQALHNTEYYPDDFHDSRYDPSFSPIVYSGQTIHGSVMLPSYGVDVSVSLYAREMRSGEIYQSEKIQLEKENWVTMEYQIPAMGGAVIDEVGFCIHVRSERGRGKNTAILPKSIRAGMTGRTIRLSFLLLWGEHHLVNVRVQGAIRSYAAGFMPNGRIGILKNENDYRLLADTEFAWESGREYAIRIEAKGDIIRMRIDDQDVLEYQDTESPYLGGQLESQVSTEVIADVGEL